MLRKIVGFQLLILFTVQTAQSQTIVNLLSNEAKTLLEKDHRDNLVIIDGRDSRMFAEGYIKDAININAFDEKAALLLAQHLQKDSLLVYCTTCNRTTRINELLKESGYSGTIMNMTDGITGWKDKNYELIKPADHKKSDQEEKKENIYPKGKPIIQVFGNFDYNATENAQKQYAFWFGRAHLGYEYLFNEQFAGKIILDAGRPTTVGAIEVNDTSENNFDVSNTSKEGSYYTITLKFASLEWKPTPFIKIQAGGILQNHYITQEKFWAYRYLAPTFQDKYFGTPSGDLGVIGYFTINKKFGFDVALTNGEGFRFDQDAFGDVKLAAGIDFNPIENLQTRFFYDYTKSDNPAKPAEQQLFSFFTGYKKDKYRIGGEYNYHKNHLNISNHNLYGWSFYGSFLFAKNMEVFARFDQLKANTLEGESAGWYYNNMGSAYITGIHYNPVNGINISVNYQGWQPKNKDLNFQNHILISFEYKL